MPLPPLLTGQVCAITGGLTGIGRAIAISFLSHGAKVSINYLASHNADEQRLLDSLRTEGLEAIRSRNSSSTVSSADQVPLLTVAGDISEPSTSKDFITATVSTFGRLDTFVSNAGICRFEDFLAIDPTSFQRHVNTNLSGAFYAVQAAAQQMVSQQSPQGGSIIGISSISALVGGAGQCHYTPTKAGVLSLMQSTATALGQYGIRCNALLPGTIRTQLNEEDLKDGSEKKAYMEKRIPLGLGKPEDMAGPAVWLAQPELSGYVSGAQILVDGGAFVNFQ